MKKYLIVGAGGFIAGHLINKLQNDGNFIRAVDIKPKEFWFQRFNEPENFVGSVRTEITSAPPST